MPSTPPPDGPPRQLGSSSSMSDFRFTISASSSGQSSFIEPDGGYEDIDSESLSESVQRFPEEFGRTYHAYRAGSYAFPNDMPEQERLEFQGLIMTELFGNKLYLSPLETTRPRRILDVATGTGDWAIQMGDKFPEASIVATDLSPIQPKEVPPNVQFFIEDSSEPWEYDQNFDYIHSRVTLGCWESYKDQLIQQAYDQLSPGGWLECQELSHGWGCDDGTLSPDDPMLKWVEEIVHCSEAVKRPVGDADKLRIWFEEVGFVDVTEKVFKVPTNGWPKDERLKRLGRMWEQNFASGVSGFSVVLFNRVFNRTPEETEVQLMEVRKHMADPRIHAWLPIYVVCGRKPYPGEAGNRDFWSTQRKRNE